MHCLSVAGLLSGVPTIVCGGDAEFVMHMGGLTTSDSVST